MFTFSTSSWGGRECVTNLGDAVARMRSVHHDAVPIVSLESAPMQTRYGRKSKPVLRIVGWKRAADAGVWDSPQLALPSLAQEDGDGVPY
jgi:hypothetical protein